MIFKKGSKKVQLQFNKVGNKKLSSETFTAVQELNEKFDTLETEFKLKIEV